MLTYPCNVIGLVSKADSGASVDREKHLPRQVGPDAGDLIDVGGFCESQGGHCSTEDKG